MSNSVETANAITRTSKVDINLDKSIKSMENPISAIFDLSESVNYQVPRIKKMIQYTGVFVSVWLIVNFVFLLWALGTGNLAAFLILIIFLGLGSFGLYWMWTLNHFFDYFSRRHLAIKLIRDADELVHVPKGRNSVQSYLTHLKKANQRLDQALRYHPQMLHTPALLMGESGVSYNFDGYIFKNSSPFWVLFGTGDPGYAFFIKAFDHTVTLPEVMALERAVQDITYRTKIIPSRIVALVEKKAGAKIDDEVYQHITTKRPVIVVGRQKCIVNLQMVSVDEDNTYDFVPVIAEVGNELP